MILTKHYPRLGLKEARKSPTDGALKVKTQSTYQYSTLVATLNIFTNDQKTVRNILYKKSWKISENDQVLWDEPRDYPLFRRPEEHRDYEGIPTDNTPNIL